MFVVRTAKSTKDAWGLFLEQEVLLLETTTVTSPVLALRNHCLVLEAVFLYLPHQTGTGNLLLHFVGFVPS